MPDTTPASFAVLFWFCAAAIVLAQVQILRSTRRAWRTSADGKENKAAPGFAEWSFAVGPVVVLGLLLWATYRAVMGVFS